ncbi:MAG: S24/S26 family peptidase, partial [Prevotella sp.]|nr:S24/S26 family peptidase [Prevotella sp.]
MQQSHLKVREIKLSNAEFLPEIVKLMDEGHTVTLRLRGFSMRPFLEDNRDKALMTKATNPKVGDPVLAEIEPKHFVLHRIIQIDGDNVTLRGDGNLGNEYCTLDDVKGAVIGF